MTRRSDPRTTRALVPASELPPFTPVPRTCQRHDGWTPERQARFIEALADTGSVHAACKAVDMSQPGAYHLRRQPGAESFRAAWQAALDLGVQRIEDVAMDRALNGVAEPLYSYGKLIGTRTKYNDRLLMLMLRNRAPERFGASVGGGSLKGLNAVGKMEKRRLKKKWRKQWEDERAAREEAEAATELEELDGQLQTMADRHRAHMSPRTRAAYAEYLRLEALDEAEGYDPCADPEHEFYIERNGGAGGGLAEAEEDAGEILALPEPEGAGDEETEPGPRVRTLRDGGGVEDLAGRGDDEVEIVFAAEAYTTDWTSL
ncbi:hypothetical protein WAB17_11005 [Parerythrobacter aurantius]|uniref:hypothetical protein n=1 Tax=Parerythrobacter aurantius TaxID=3127706 RepID=UPI0032546330